MEGMRSRLLGVAIIWLGITLLAGNFQLGGEFGQILNQSWPILIILFGLSYLFETKRDRKIIGLIIAFFGLGLLGDRLGWFIFNMRSFWSTFWAVALILFGWKIMGGGTADKTNWVVMSGYERKGSSWELKGGSFHIIMGGVELDLRDAIIPEGETDLDFTVIMGGIEIRLPDELDVCCEGTAILGGLEFLGQSSGGIYGDRIVEQTTENASRKVNIKCRVFLGGVEVK